MVEQDTPFRGMLTGHVHWELSDECQPYQPVRTVWEAEGVLTAMGPTNAAGKHCADERGGGSGGQIVFTAANGDTLHATYTFTLRSESPTLLTMKMTGRFVAGGTGRFAGASGSWTAVAQAHTIVAPPTVETIWPVDFTFEGQVACGIPGEQ